jgi:hypothetical protein
MLWEIKVIKADHDGWCSVKPIIENNDVVYYCLIKILPTELIYIDLCFKKLILNYKI